MKQTKFSKGDKVFAKVRGYPAWPARIDGAADETPNKMKYHVYFYGTAETGVVKAEDICSYVSNKSKLVKRKKYKNLSEAIIEIEEDMTPEELAELNAAQESGANESVKEDDSIQEEKTKKEDDKESGKIGDKRRQSGSLKTQKGKTAAKSTPHLRKSTPPPPQPTVTLKEKTPPQNTPAKKRKADDEPEKTAKKSKRTTSTIVDEVSSSSTLPDPIPPSVATVEEEIISSEEEETRPKEIPEKQEAKIVKPEPVKKQEKEKAVEKPAPKTSPEIMSRSGRKIKPKRFDDDETCTKSKDKSKDYLHVGKDTINEFKIPLKLNRPIFINSKFAAEWDKSVLEHANSLKTMIESGDFTGNVHDHMDDYTQLLAAEFKKKQTEEQHNYIFNEGRILDTEMSIKTSLTLDSPDVIKCIKHLDEMDALPFSALLLKKYPNIVLTIKKVRKYVGNTRKWSMTPEEAEDFNENARIVRSKADHLYNKFKSLFLVPKGQSFYIHFTKEADAFGRKMQHLSMDEVFTIMED